MKTPRRILVLFTFLLLVEVAAARDEKSIQDLGASLATLASDVDPVEAELLSATAHTTARSLAREYRVVLQPDFQNFLINVGLRERGYCGHWARDIGDRLKELKLKTLLLYWGTYDPGTRRESNCVVITARRQAFQDGIVIDGWRRKGRLYWSEVTKDEKYKWKEDPLYTAWLRDYRHIYEFEPAVPRPMHAGVTAATPGN